MFWLFAAVCVQIYKRLKKLVAGGDNNDKLRSRLDIVTQSVQSVIVDKANERDRQDKRDAFLVGDVGDIVNKYKTWIAQLPRVEPFYAVKCNDDSAVLAVLAELGCGFDCASKGEIEKVLDLNVSPSRIIYANACKQASFVRFAAERGVDLMTFDSELELHKVKANHPNAKLLVRILPPISDKCLLPIGTKFGCRPQNVRRLLRVAKQIDVDVVGVSFHVGSGCHDSSAFSAAVESARAVFDMAETEGFHFNLLDIGGGFPGQASDKLSFDEVLAELRPALDRCFPDKSSSSAAVRIIAEPGRYFVASAFTLAVNVIGVRSVIDESNPDDENNSAEQMYMYYVNDGVYGSFHCVLLDCIHIEARMLDPTKMPNKPLFKSIVWGPTCAGNDYLIKECMLPRLSINDWIIFEDMGAYTMSITTSFNGMPRPQRYYIIDEDNYWYTLKHTAAAAAGGDDRHIAAAAASVQL